MVRATMSQTALHDVVRHATIGEYEILVKRMDVSVVVARGTDQFADWEVSRLRGAIQ